jgi:hypothetical protein
LVEAFDVIMGKKGIGKLAGFGLAAEMQVCTWQEGHSTTFALDIDNLKTDSGKTGTVGIKGTRSGSRIGPNPMKGRGYSCAT